MIGYEVYRDGTPALDDHQRPAAATTYTDETASPSTTYTYR